MNAPFHTCTMFLCFYFRDQSIDERGSNYISAKQANYYYPQNENEYSEEQFQDPYVKNSDQYVQNSDPYVQNSDQYEQNSDPYVQNSDPYVQNPYGNAYSDDPYQDYIVPQTDYTVTYQYNNNQIDTSYYNQYTSDPSGQDQFDPAISSTGSYDDHNEFTDNQRKDDNTNSELRKHHIKSFSLFFILALFHIP